ncbi:MAG: DUF1249 domain-containing protein [Gammaproteobacteria bacterium]|nr:DUF1249 domain-containing protein [Gammaproteobacteria bacterium]
MRKPHKENSQALCEANYRSLRRLFPGIKDLGCWTCGFFVSGQELDVEIIEQTPYTTTARMALSVHGQLCVPASQFLIRMYHDARVAEVLNFQGHERLQPHYHYPNDNLYYADEKRQVNRLLWEGLMMCERFGLEVRTADSRIAI